jgi:hypothetical protein
MPRGLLEHVKSEKTGVERLRSLEIANGQEDVSDTLQFDHGDSPLQPFVAPAKSKRERHALRYLPSKATIDRGGKCDCRPPPPRC